MSRAAGRALLPRPRHDDPVRATTAGVGQLLLAAHDAGARRIVIGCGGSSTTDGGLGAYEAVGSPPHCEGSSSSWPATSPRASLTPPPCSGRRRAPRRRRSWSSADASSRSPPATGTRRASTSPRIPGGGAAGGLAGGLVALGARIEPGFDFVAGLVGLAGRLEQADLVVTGEGHLDPPSFHGKVPGGVLELARARAAAGPAGPVHRRRRRRVGPRLAASGPRRGQPHRPLRPGPGAGRDDRADQPGHRRGAAPVLPLNEPIGHTAGAPRRLSTRPPGPPLTGRPGWRSDRHREASPWDCSTARWRLSPARDEASDAKRRWCSPVRAPGSSSTTWAPGCTARARRTRTPPTKSWR